MVSVPPLQHSVSVWTYCARNWFPTALCVLVFTGWHFGVTRELSIAAVLFFSALCVTCYLAGTLILRILPVSCLPSADYPFSFLLGYVFVSSSLFLLALVVPFGVKVNLIALAVAIVVSASATRMAPAGWSAGRSLKAGGVAVAISLLAASFWSQDAIRPVDLIGQEAPLRHWPDSFFHARMISMFANQGLGAPLQSINATGEPLLPYHYATYLLPAALASFSGTPAYGVFGSLMMPAGIFLTGLAAYSIGTAFWGDKGGIAAAVALLLLPDAAQQGMQNYWYSYHFLQQIAPAQPYGVAILAAAWVYMLHGCRTGNVVALGASYVLAAVSILYKAQLFIASAFLILVFPAFFFTALSWRKRVTWFSGCTIVCWLALKLAEGIPRAPTIEFDGRGFLQGSGWIIKNFDSFWIREFLTLYLPQPGDSRLYSVLWILVMAAILLVITFGCFLLLYVALAWWLRKMESRMVVLFPLLIIGVYMLMSVGLSLNASIAGHPDELIHRPFVWAYFVVCTWVGGGAWIAVSRWLPETRWPAMAAAIVPLLVPVPLILGRGIVLDTPGAWNNAAQWTVSAGLVKAAYFIRDHSRATDIVQDSQGDWRLILCGLSERQPYALWQLSIPENVLHLELSREQLAEVAKARALVNILPKVNRDRFFEIFDFMNLSRKEDIIAFVRYRHIRWFVTHPGDVLAWPQSIVDSFSFEWGGYRVYEFVPYVEI